MIKNEQAKQAAIADLKNHIHEGDTIYTVVRHRSTSGMYRAIDCYVFRPETKYREMISKYSGKMTGEAYWTVIKLRYTWSISTALGYRYDKKHEAIGISGCGFDAAYQIVEDLSYVLFGSANKLRKEEI